MGLDEDRVVCLYIILLSVLTSGYSYSVGFFVGIPFGRFVVFIFISGVSARMVEVRVTRDSSITGSNSSVSWSRFLENTFTKNMDELNTEPVQKILDAKELHGFLEQANYLVWLPARF